MEWGRENSNRETFLPKTQLNGVLTLELTLLHATGIGKEAHRKKDIQSNIIIPSQGQHRWTVIYQCFKTAAFCTHKIGGQIQNTPRSQLHTAVSCLGKQIKSKDLLLGYLEVHWGLWSVGPSCSQLIQTHAGAWILSLDSLWAQPPHPSCCHSHTHTGDTPSKVTWPSKQPSPRVWDLLSSNQNSFAYSNAINIETIARFSKSATGSLFWRPGSKPSPLLNRI